MSIWKEDIVIKNKFSRPAYKLLSVKGLVIHWTATFGATDENEASFFDGSDGGGGRYASAHIFVDKDSATLIIPLDEVAYHANDKPCKIEKLKATASYYNGGGANLTTIGIEMCVEKDGTIHADTIARTVDIVAELCRMYKLNPLNDIYRHYDITGKNCPAPWVATPQKFVDFKNSVNAKLNKPATTTISKPSTNLYRVRKTWADVSSQIGAYALLNSAIELAKANVGYEVYDGSGKQVFPVVDTTKPVDVKSYTIVAGDTYWGISKKTGVSVDNLKKFNPRVNPDKLQIGDVIYLVPVTGTVPVPSKPAPAPKPTPKPAPKPVPKKKYIVLPASAETWRVYPTNKTPKKGNESGLLSPKRFGGLTYEVLANPQTDVYTIKTDSFGKVNIYASSSTGAKIIVK